MDKKSFEKYIEKFFTANTLPYLMDFVRVPNLSPAYDYQWNTNGKLIKAANLVISFAKSLQLRDANINLLQDKGRTPLIYIEIPATRQNDNRTVLMYAHFDKQPYGNGWDTKPTDPVIKDDHLYGRGSADDGYALFSILTAVKACQDHNCPLPRICIIYEGCEESDDADLTHYFDKLTPSLGKNVIAFIPLDSGCSDYKRLWITNSLRGVMGFYLNIQTLNTDCNYGPEASGRVAEQLFILRKVLEGIMDLSTGDVIVEECHVKEIPPDIEKEIDKQVEIVKDTFFDEIPLAPGVKPLKEDCKEAIINNTWQPTCVVLGMDNCPQLADNGFGVYKSLKVKVSMRLPPLIIPENVIAAVKKAVEANIYFGAKVTVENPSVAEGWVLTGLTEKCKKILNKASLEYFGNEMVFRGVGGSIPFINHFASVYPNADIICTGILGADSHEHGPNENLNITACKKVILCLCYFLSEI